MIKEELKRTYFKLLFPLLLLLVLIYLGQYLGIINRRELELNRIVSVAILVLIALFSLALPIFYRTFFVNKIKDRKSITGDEILKFEKELDNYCHDSSIFCPHYGIAESSRFLLSVRLLLFHFMPYTIISLRRNELSLKKNYSG